MEGEGLDLRSLNNNSTYIKVDDVVLIHDDNAGRNLWRIDRVIKLIKRKSDSEEKETSVKVTRTGSTVQRPIEKLIPIECIEWHLQISDQIDEGFFPRLYNFLVGMFPLLTS